uniref:Uncharacterized protein n=1 Tax=Arundo donax TaxID=35708 RepID=A0A0A9GS43_ARUDO
MGTTEYVSCINGSERQSYYWQVVAVLLCKHLHAIFLICTKLPDTKFGYQEHKSFRPWKPLLEVLA